MATQTTITTATDEMTLTARRVTVAATTMTSIIQETFQNSHDQEIHARTAATPITTTTKDNVPDRPLSPTENATEDELS